MISNPVIINLELEEDNTHYRSVIHVAENSDFHSGTRQSPYPNIQEAIDNSGGDIIYVHPGTYLGFTQPHPSITEPDETQGAVTLKDSVTIIGAGADSTFLSGDVVAESVSGASISGFKLTRGINTISSSMTITNNVITNPAGNAIWGSKSDFQIINNVLYGNNPEAVFLSDSSNAIIKNNIIVNNSGFGISGMESASATIDYNNVWGNGENYSGNFIPGVHDLSVDPQFVDAANGNFHLQAGSQCIDAGDPASQFNDPDGSRNDLGAFGGPFAPDIITSIANEDLYIPIQFELYQNYPNPFNPTTIIRYSIPEQTHVSLKVYNILGSEVKTLINKQQSIGNYTVELDGLRLPSGIYFYRIVAGDYIDTKKMVLMK